MQQVSRLVARLWLEMGKLLSDRGLSREMFLALFHSGYHEPYLARHRAMVINTRVRLIAWTFALLLVAWIAIDLLFLPRDIAWQLAKMRGLSSLAYLILALSITERSRWHYALLRVVFMITIPLLFYIMAQRLFNGASVDRLGMILVGVYNLLPFVAVAGLAIFPLTLLESLAIGLASLVVMSMGPILSNLFTIQSYFPAAWILLLILVTCTMAAAIQLNYMRSLLQRISTDHLTGAFTRRTGQELIDLYFQLSIEQGKPFAIAFLDLDHFKVINDEYGHDAGDAALTGAVRRLKAMLRRGDLVVRWGGEEFLVILADADRGGVALVFERITREWLGMRPDGTPLTASIGVAERMDDHQEDWLGLVELADRRMYLAKQGGRARMVLNGG